MVKHRHILGSLLALCLPLTSALAAGNNSTAKAPGGFSAEMRGSQTLSYDSNPLRSTNGKQSIYGFTTSPRLILRKKTPLSVIESDTQIDANMFDRSAFNSVDISQQVLLSTENERWSASTKGFLERDTTRTSELTNYGRNLPRVYRTRIGGAPQISFRPNSTSTWSLGATAADVNYDNRTYQDYSTYSLAPSYTRRFDAKNSGVISLNGQRYETTEGSRQRSTSAGPSLGWVYTPTPRLTTRMTAGAQRTQKNGSNAGSDRILWNYVFTGSVIYKGNVNAVDFTATRAREPFGNGTETLLTTFALKGEHAINPRLAIKLGGAYQTADYESAPGINLDHGWNIGTGLAYMLYDTIDFAADYRYRSESLTGIPGGVDQHSVMLSLNYHPSWSRD